MISRLLFLLTGVAVLQAAEDPTAIIRRMVTWDQANWLRSKDYTYLQYAEERELDDRGKVKKTQSETEELSFLYGFPYYKKIAKNGQKLTGDAARNEDEKMSKAAAERQRDLEHGGRKRQDWEKKRAEERKFLQEIPDAYTFQILRQDKVDGLPVWVIAATPRPDYRPKSSDARQLLPKVKPTFWVDQRDAHMARLDFEVLDTISFGLVLARIYRGTNFTLQQAYVNNEVWLPQHVLMHINGRLALLKKLNGEVEVTWRDFRKFQTDSKIVPVE